MQTYFRALISVGAFFLLVSCNTAPTPTPPNSLNVMSFNIRFNNPNDGENAWPHRKALVANTVQFYRADLVGVQEALKEQLDDLSALLPEFVWLGVGRDDGKEQGEYSAILYRKDRFEVLQQVTFWLSEEPEQPGSVGWDAAITRVVTWAKFQDKRDAKKFFLFNTHFDHVGQRAREESAKLLLRQIQNVAGSEPVIVTGDFNATASNPVYEILVGNAVEQDSTTQAHGLINTREISRLPHYGPDWTFHDFGRATERPGIDYIFVNHRLNVLRHGIIADPAGGPYTSDHLPVLAEVVIQKK